MSLINYYIIHCNNHNERLNNIENNIKSVIPELEIWDGTCVTTIEPNISNQFKRYDTNIEYDPKFFNIKYPGQIGCYLSHHLLVKNILNNLPTNGYTLILEDDIEIKKELKTKLHNIINSGVNFDIIFLGLIHDYKQTNNKLLYELPNDCVEGKGTHSLFICNKNAGKLYKENCFPKGPIDVHYGILSVHKKINCYFIYPYLCNQMRTQFASTIQCISTRKNSRKNIRPSINYTTYADKVRLKEQQASQAPKAPKAPKAPRAPKLEQQKTIKCIRKKTNKKPFKSKQ